METDSELVSHLQAGDEEAFVSLVERYHAAMVRRAMGFVPTRAVAEEVAQEAWLGATRWRAKWSWRATTRAAALTAGVWRRRARGRR